MLPLCYSLWKHVRTIQMIDHWTAVYTLPPISVIDIYMYRHWWRRLLISLNTFYAHSSEQIYAYPIINKFVANAWIWFIRIFYPSCHGKKIQETRPPPKVVNYCLELNCCIKYINFNTRIVYEKYYIYIYYEADCTKCAQGKLMLFLNRQNIFHRQSLSI